MKGEKCNNWNVGQEETVVARHFVNLGRGLMFSMCSSVLQGTHINCISPPLKRIHVPNFTRVLTHQLKRRPRGNRGRHLVNFGRGLLFSMWSSSSQGTQCYCFELKLFSAFSDIDQLKHRPRRNPSRHLVNLGRWLFFFMWSSFRRVHRNCTSLSLKRIYFFVGHCMRVVILQGY